jgi:hypothetical protein
MSAAGRQQLRTPGPWLAAAIALACTTPVLWWNAQHDWVSLRFQSGRAANTTAWSIAPFLENVSGQALWLLPWMAIPMAIAMGMVVVRHRTDERGWFFACLALLPVGLFTVATLGGARGLPHWQAPGWVVRSRRCAHQSISHSMPSTGARSATRSRRAASTSPGG